MLKIAINGKELKEIIEKAVCNMLKKSALPILEKVVLQSENGNLSVITSKLSEYLKVSTENYTCTSDGKIAIDKEDLKVLLKMTDKVEIIETEKNIIVKTGKKTISLMKHNVTDFPNEPDGDFIVRIRMKESEFVETINNLAIFTDKCEDNKIMQCLHFNLSDNRVEALDGYRIGMKRIDDVERVGTGNFLLHNTIVSDLKKTLDKKSNSNIVISIGDKFNRVSGKNFTYYTINVDGRYFEVNKMLTNDFKTIHKVGKNTILNCIKYYTDNVIARDTKKPIIFNISNKKIITYGRNERFEVSDEVEIKDFAGNNFAIAFNPYYLLDALKISNIETIIMRYNGSKMPLFIDADKYLFCVLPVNNVGEFDAMERYLDKVKAAKIESE